jgi:hypothetical protein
VGVAAQAGKEHVFLAVGRVGWAEKMTLQPQRSPKGRDDGGLATGKVGVGVGHADKAQFGGEPSQILQQCIFLALQVPAYEVPDEVAPQVVRRLGQVPPCPQPALVGQRIVRGGSRKSARWVSMTPWWPSWSRRWARTTSCSRRPLVSGR